MAKPQPFAQMWGQQTYNQGYTVAKMYYDEMMKLRAQWMNFGDVVKDLKSGKIDISQVSMNDDGFDVAPDNPKKPTVIGTSTGSQGVSTG